MGLFSLLKEIFTDSSVTIGELNKAATAAPKKEVRKATEPVRSTPKALKSELLIDISDIEISNEYKLIKALIEYKYPFIFVNGKAGSGKSTLIRYLRYSFKDKNVVVVAPTGVAALNVHGSTIHSLFHFPPRFIDLNDIHQVTDRKLYCKIDIIIIDEVSMVRVDMIDAMDNFMRLNGPKQNLPFGGVQIIFIGDLFQLPPIVKEPEKELFLRQHYKSPYFFSAKSLENYRLIPVELNKIYRQRDDKYTAILNAIRIADNVGRHLPIINSRVQRSKTDLESKVTLTSDNKTADQINKTELARLSGEEKTFIGMATGVFAVKDERLPSPMELSVKVGSQIMFTKNDMMKRWVNGTVGKVIAIEEYSIRVSVITDFGVQQYDVGPVSWENYSYRYDEDEDKIVAYIIGSYTQIPVMLAWAITIHKSQGKTLGKMHLNLGNGAFATGQVYVALSRVRELTDLSLENAIRLHDVRCDPIIIAFFNNLAHIQERTKAIAASLVLDDIELSEKQCPYCWSTLREVVGKNGPFIGCSGYPVCKYTRNI